MSNLENYIKNYNTLQEIFGFPRLETPSNFEEAKPLFRKLATDLSPENLHRDGEASRAEVDARRALIKGAWADLEAICERTVSESDVY